MEPIKILVATLLIQVSVGRVPDGLLATSGRKILQTAPQGDYCVKTRYDFNGQNDYASVDGITPSTCRDQCDTEAKCSAVTFVKYSKRCYKKSFATGDVPTFTLNSSPTARVISIKGKCAQLSPELKNAVDEAEAAFANEFAELDQTCSDDIKCVVGLDCSAATSKCVLGAPLIAELDEDCTTNKCAATLTCNPTSKVCEAGPELATMDQTCSATIKCIPSLTCSPVSKLCVGPAKLGETCSDTLPCATSLACDPSTKFCVASSLANLGEACGGTTNCVATLSCDVATQMCVAAVQQLQPLGEPCDVLSKCEVGLSCMQGICAITLPAGQACTADTTCAENLVCADALCTAVTRVPGGQACNGFSTQCVEGFTCDVGTCMAAEVARSLSEVCSSSVPCLTGLECIDNSCIAVTAPGAACLNQAPCGEGYTCTADVCTVKEIAAVAATCSDVIDCVAGSECIEAVCVSRNDVITYDCSSKACPGGYECSDGKCVANAERLACAGKCPSGSTCADSMCRLDTGTEVAARGLLPSCGGAVCEVGYRCTDAVCLPDLRAGMCGTPPVECAAGKICGADMMGCVTDPGLPTAVRDLVSTDEPTCAAAPCPAGYLCFNNACEVDTAAGTCDPGCASGEICQAAAGECSPDTGLPVAVTQATCTATSCPSSQKCGVTGVCEADTNVASCSADACVAGEYCPEGGIECVKDVLVPAAVYNEAELIQEKEEARVLAARSGGETVFASIAPGSEASKPKKRKSWARRNWWKIFLICLAVLFALLCCCGLCVFCLKKKKSDKDTHYTGKKSVATKPATAVPVTTLSDNYGAPGTQYTSTVPVRPFSPNGAAHKGVEPATYVSGMDSGTGHVLGAAALAAGTTPAALKFSRMTVDPSNNLGRSLPAVPAQAGSQLDSDLDKMSTRGTSLLDKYTVLGPTERRQGGQGIVQFTKGRTDGKEYAAKFYLDKEAFAHEQNLHRDPVLQKIMPAVVEIIPNADEKLRGRSTTPVPPFIVMEKGQNLNEYANKNTLDFAGTKEVLVRIAKRIQELHVLGKVHRDLKPANILFRPDSQLWTLIDFGCTSSVGSKETIAYSPLYASPEVVHAVEDKQMAMTVAHSADVWSFGVIAYEMFTRSSAFPYGSSVSDVNNKLAGRSPLPWEKMSSAHKRALGTAAPTVLAMLHRDPSKRPSIAAVIKAWEPVGQQGDGYMLN